MNTALESLVKVMTREMQVYNIAAILSKHNSSHKAKEIAKVLRIVYRTRYNISLKKEAAYLASDTCRATTNVLENLDAEQVSHVSIFQIISLLLLFSFSMTGRNFSW